MKKIDDVRCFLIKEEIWGMQESSKKMKNEQEDSWKILASGNIEDEKEREVMEVSLKQVESFWEIQDVQEDNWEMEEGYQD